MKPIVLSIKGLHSFREEQTIDFEGLSGAGVFGIFGPTGSGKSSILDAMTLALYGKVERAANNTHGILNHAEDTLSVSFTFALQTNHQISYKVERVFKRTDEMKVKTALCRFIEIRDEHTVLADKASEVNKRVEELLGLTIDDFTRAVVLPQGKFAEFLSLKGAERRHMLQRLFNLEQYGDRLVKKLRRQAQEANARKNEMLAEQSGLGEASSEAVEQAEQALEQAEARLEAMRKNRDQAKERFTEYQEIWNVQKEKAAYEEEKKRLEKEQLHVDSMKKRLLEAETAAALKPYADRYAEAIQHEEKAEKEQTLAQKDLADRTAFFHQKHEEYEEWRQHKSGKEPELLTEQEQLSRLQEIEVKLSEAKQDEERKKAELQQKEEALQSVMNELETVTDRLTRGQNRQTELKQQLKSLQVTSDERKSCQQAAEMALRIRQTEEQIRKEKKRSDALNLVLQKMNEEKSTLVQKTEAEKSNIIQAYEAVQTVYHMVCETERSLTRMTEQAKKRQQTLHSQREKARMALLTKELAEKLTAGKPCPVCGSTHHDPSASVHETYELDSNLEKNIKQTDVLLTEAAALSQEILSAKITLEEQSARFIEQCPFLQTIQAPNLEAAASYENQPVQEAFDTATIEWKQVKQDILSVKTRMAQVISAYQESLKTADQLNEKIGFEQREADRIDSIIAELQSSMDSRLKMFKEAFQDQSVNEAEKWQQAIEEKDRAAEECEKRIEKSIAFLAEHEAQKEKLRESGHQLEREKLELHYAAERIKSVIADYEHELGDYAKGDSIQIKLRSVQQDLKLLKEKEQSLYEELQSAQTMLNQAKSRASASELTLKEAKDRLEKAEAAWLEHAKSTRFTRTEEVERSLIPDAELEKMKAGIDQFMDKLKQNAANLERVAEILAGRALSESEWSETVTALQEAEDAFGAAIEEKGAAAKALAVIRDHHKRFNEIEAELKKWQTHIDRLDKLQAVFKGNTFVEFLAEEQLESVARDASARLGMLTRQRYAIEVDSEGGFVMRDNANGGVKRPVSSLSGGETFLTSLSLALALSAQIQLRGEYPLQFFFLDEGFGTLDQDLLDTVVTALEKLQSDNLSVGVISHVQELRARLPKKLIVHPAEPSGRGTRVTLELM
ncbi:exonuclease subunit SbcC [Bacillus spizizenii ATCC 6633 = JCM 2499]|uniref:Nuclease SbcCD subunit C n=1 Tax=Bacillus spizizenii (strain ATCC 23059 / NRRL B-14472 / W23) TaxID=655816 RepID=E0TYT2_BACSH|nr:exonuclease subunit SbcC [Bacillus spizizenii]QCJ16389.1 SMC family ATPase [Bacillus subtilis]ADM37133.1 DNA ATP-dependent repair enzyme [Bacillus spizizenii str. W23]AJW86524.1 nuclease SbcCD subunit C [Bacillus spizizenii]EFG91295.1 DNA ATP-dependent repair enzyme [Bacillus spizizenii ATCC 6633 = JCM 2499]KFK80786.1 AAA domain protein [Bacillus spizizenii]